MSKFVNQSKPCRIFHKPSKTWFEVTPEQYAEYARWCTRIRKRMQYHGRCRCTRNKWWLCDGLCDDCEFHAPGDMHSLDKPICNDESDEITLLDTLIDPDPLIENIIANKDELKHLLDRLNELLPEAIEIGKLRRKGLTDELIAKQIGVKRTTFRSRISKARNQLAAEFPDRF